MTLRAYADGEWLAADAGRVVKLGSFRSQDRGAITTVDGSGRNRVGGTAITSAGVQ